MTLDVTFDLETCALCPTAAVLSLGAVAWNRAGETTPFIMADGKDDLSAQYYTHVDLRSSFLDGFTFEQSTADWWAKQNDAAKKAVLENDNDMFSCLPIKDVIVGFVEWLRDRKEDSGADSVCLWCQGSDFDIAILRNICHKYNLEIPVNHTNFRDHRTFFLEGVRTICDRSGAEFNEKEAYKMVEQYEGKGAPHDPIFDCKRSIYSTWQMMKHLRCVNP